MSLIKVEDVPIIFRGLANTGKSLI